MIRECLFAALIVRSFSKESLESNLYEVQNAVGQLDVRKEQLEGENQELLLRKEHLQGEVQRLHAELNCETEKSARSRDQLQQRLAQLEQEKETSLRQYRQNHDDDIERMTRERDKLRHELETGHEEAVRQHARDKDESTQRHEKDKEDLRYELANAIADRDQSLIESENEKQKVHRASHTPESLNSSASSSCSPWRNRSAMLSPRNSR